MKILNAAGYIEDLSWQLKKVLEKVGWELKDGLGYFEYKPNSRENGRGNKTLPDSWMVLYPCLLEYTEELRDIKTFWFKTGEREISEEGMESLLTALTPFKDEDYIGRNFWFNPLYPNGYWQNHTLSG